MSMKNSNDTIGNQTHNPPACSAVPQPTALPHVPLLVLVTYSISRHVVDSRLHVSYLQVQYVFCITHSKTSILFTLHSHIFWSELSSSGYTYAVDITHWLIYSAVLYHISYRPLRITYSNAMKYSLIPDCTWLNFRIWQHVICEFLNLMWKISFVTSCWLNYCIAIGWLTLLPSLCYCREIVPSVHSCQQSVFKCMMEQLSTRLICLGVKFKLGLIPMDT